MLVTKQRFEVRGSIDRLRLPVHRVRLLDKKVTCRSCGAVLEEDSQVYRYDRVKAFCVNCVEEVNESNTTRLGIGKGG